MSSVNRGECATIGGLYRPTHLCVAHFELHKKFERFIFCFFCDVVRLGFTFFLMVGAGRDCGKDGWGPSRYYLLCWSIV